MGHLLTKHYITVILCPRLVDPRGLTTNLKTKINAGTATRGPQNSDRIVALN